jgi:hypothetical protein
MENFLKKNCRRTLFPKNTNLPPAISKKKIVNKSPILIFINI